MSSSTWQQKFHDRLTGLEDIYRSEQPGVSFLAYALREGRISDDDYLEWASENLQMPSVVNAFFSEKEPQLELLERIQYPWSVECFPIAEWDGHLIVGCLEKPTEAPATKNMIFVLAPYENLSLWWNRILPNQTSMAGSDSPDGLSLTGASAATDAPDGLSTSESSSPALDFSSAKPLIVEKPAEASAAETIESAVVESTVIGAPTVAANSDAPLSVDNGSLEMALVDFEKTITKIAVLPPDESKKKDPPRELKSEPTAATKPSAPPVAAVKPAAPPPKPPPSPILQPVTPKSPSPLAAGVPSNPKDLVAKVAAEKARAAVAKLASATKAAAESAPPPAPEEGDAVVSYFMDRTSTRHGAASVEPSSPLPPLSLKTATPAANDTSLLPQLAANHGDFKVLVEHFSGQLKAHYQEIIFYSITPDGKFLKPYAWSEGLGDATGTRIPLEGASLFSIAVSTEKSYHGYVVPNPINDQAFSALGFEKAPEHVTAIPLIFSNQIIGLVMAVGEKHCSELPILRWVEKISSQLMRDLGGRKGMAA